MATLGNSLHCQDRVGFTVFSSTAGHSNTSTVPSPILGVSDMVSPGFLGIPPRCSYEDGPSFRPCALCGTQCGRWCKYKQKFHPTTTTLTPEDIKGSRVYREPTSLIEKSVLNNKRDGRRQPFTTTRPGRELPTPSVLL